MQPRPHNYQRHQMLMAFGAPTITPMALVPYKFASLFCYSLTCNSLGALNCSFKMALKMGVLQNPYFEACCNHIPYKYKNFRYEEALANWHANKVKKSRPLRDWTRSSRLLVSWNSDVYFKLKMILSNILVIIKCILKIQWWCCR